MRLGVGVKVNARRRRSVGAPPPVGPTASSVTERGVTLTFWDAASGGNARELPVRQYHDGSWAVTHDGGPIFVDVLSPAYQLITGLPVDAFHPDGTRAINGLMVNPGAAYVSGSRGTNGLGTPGDLSLNALGTPQGYDSRVASVTALPYNAALNYHPGRTGTRLRYDPGQEATLAVAISISSPGTVQTNLQEVVYVTICNTLPPVGSLRPAPAAISKASPGLVSALDLSVLPNDPQVTGFTTAPSAIAPTVANALAFTARPNLMVQYTTGNNAETISPVGHHPAYGRDVARRYNLALSLLCEDISATDKRAIAANIAQHALDHFERIAQGGVFTANGQVVVTAGGHDQWRLPMCAIAARMMQSFPRYAEFAGYCGNMNLWPEPDQIALVRQVNTYQTTGDTHANDQNAGEPQGGARKQMRAWNVGMPEFVPTGNSRWGKAYRDINDGMMAIGLVNLHRVSGAAALIPGPALQLMVDYVLTRSLNYWNAGFIPTATTGLNRTNGQWDYDLKTIAARWTPQGGGPVARTGANFETAYGTNTAWATFDKPLDVAGIPATTAFTVTVNGLPRNVTAVDVMWLRCCVTFDGAALVETDDVRISYAVPGTGFLRTVASVTVGAFSNVQAVPVPLNTPSASFDRVQSVSGAYVEQNSMPGSTIRKFVWCVEFAELAGATTGTMVSNPVNTNTFIRRQSATQISLNFLASTTFNCRLNISPSTSLRRLMFSVDGTNATPSGVVCYLDDTLLTPASLTHIGFNQLLNAASAWQRMRFFADHLAVTFPGSLRYAWFWSGDAAASLPDLTQQSVRDGFLYANQIGNNGRGPGNVLPQPLVRIGAPLASWNDPLGILSEGAYGPPWTNPVSGSSFALAP